MEQFKGPNFASVKQMADRSIIIATRYINRFVSEEEQFAKCSYVKIPVRGFDLYHQSATLSYSETEEKKPILYAELIEASIPVEESSLKVNENPFTIGTPNEKTSNIKKRLSKKKSRIYQTQRVISVLPEKLPDSGKKLIEMHHPLRGVKSESPEESTRMTTKENLKGWRDFVYDILIKKVKSNIEVNEEKTDPPLVRAKIKRSKREMAKLKSNFIKREKELMAKSNLAYDGKVIGEEDRDFGGGPHGVTMGGMKQETFDSMFFKEKGLDYRFRFQKYTKDDNISERTPLVISRTNFKVDLRDFRKSDLLFLKTREKEILEKVEKKRKEKKINRMIFFSQVYLILVHGCRLKLLDTVKYFFENFSEYFHVDKLFVYSYPDEISFIPKNWFLFPKWIYPNNETYPMGNALIHIASANYDYDMVRYLVEERGASVNLQDCCGRTPLMLCLSDLRLVKYFLSKKVDVNHQTPYGVTPLMILSTVSYTIDIVKTLLDAGANPAIIDKCGRSSINYFMSVHGYEVLQLFIRPFLYPESPLGYLSYSGHPLFLQEFAEQDLNALSLLPQTTVSQKVSLKYLYFVHHAIELRLTRELDKLKKYLIDAVKYLEETGLVLQYPELLEAYGFRKEVQTVEDIIDQILYHPAESTSEKMEIGFQALLISNRICGPYSWTSMYINRMMVDLMSYHNSNHKDKLAPEDLLSSKLACKKLLMHFAAQMSIYIYVAGPSLNSHALLDKFISCVSSFLNYNKLKMDDDLVQVYHDMSDAMINYFTATSYTHIHHETYHLKSEDFLMKTWLSTLCSYKSKAEYLKPVLHRFYRDCDFTYLKRGAPATLINEMVVMYDYRDNDFSDYYEMVGHEHLISPCMGGYPLHYMADHPHHSGVRSLVELGAHLDTVDFAGLRPVSATFDDQIRMYLLHRQGGLNLSCICANTIVYHNIPYHKLDLPSHIKRFISIHDPKVHYRLYRKHLGLPPNNYETEDD